MKKITYLFAAFCAVMSVNATVYKVSPAGAGIMDGSSWENAMPVTSVQATIEGNPSAGSEFWLSKGTYTTKVFDYTGAAKIPVCKIYGGFSGDNESETVDSRNWSANVTILDGGSTGIQLMKYGGGANPAFPQDGNVYIDGMTFYKNGALTKDYVLTFNSYKGVLTVVNCIFKECSAKRGVVQMNNAVAATTGEVNIVNCHFYNNTITGGYNATAGTGSISSAIVQVANSTCNVVNCTIADNAITTTNPSGQLGIISGQGNSIFNVSNNIIYSHAGVTSYSVSNIETLATASVDNSFTAKNNASDLSISGSNNVLLSVSPFVSGAYALDRTNGAACINAGDNSVYLSTYPSKDLGAKTRIAETTIDLGAYESEAPNGFETSELSRIVAYRVGSKATVNSDAGEIIRIYTLQGVKVAEIVASSTVTSFYIPVKGMVVLNTSRGSIKL